MAVVSTRVSPWMLPPTTSTAPTSETTLPKAAVTPAAIGIANRLCAAIMACGVKSRPHEPSGPSLHSSSSRSSPARTGGIPMPVLTSTVRVPRPRNRPAPRAIPRGMPRAAPMTVAAPETTTVSPRTSLSSDPNTPSNARASPTTSLRKSTALSHVEVPEPGGGAEQAAEDHGLDPLLHDPPHEDGGGEHADSDEDGEQDGVGLDLVDDLVGPIGDRDRNLGEKVEHLG